MILPKIGTYPRKSIEQMPDGYLPIGVVVTFPSVIEFCAWMRAHTWYEVRQWYGDVLILKQTVDRGRLTVDGETEASDVQE